MMLLSLLDSRLNLCIINWDFSLNSFDCIFVVIMIILLR